MVKAGSVERKPDGGWQIDREWYGQGYIFKDEEAFLTTPDAPCYVAELSDAVYTHHDILRICNGQEEIAKLCFDEIDWQHPETWLDEAIMNDEFEMCFKDEKMYQNLIGFLLTKTTNQQKQSVYHRIFDPHA